MDEVPLRKDWTTLRDKAGGKAGLVSGVNVGQLIDDYFKADSAKKRLKPSEKLQAGLEKYKKGVEKLKPPLPKLVKLVNQMIAAAKDHHRQLQMNSDSGVYMTEIIKRGLVHCHALATTPTVAVYHKFYGQTIRAMGQAFKRLGDEAADLVGPWNALVEDYEDDLPPDEDGENYREIAEAVDRHLRQLHGALTDRGLI